MALVTLLPQLRPSDRKPRSGGKIGTEVQETVAVELAAVKEFHELAGLASLELLKTFDLAHKRGRCVCGEETARTKFHFAQPVRGMGEHIS